MGVKIRNNRKKGTKMERHNKLTAPYMIPNEGLQQYSKCKYPEKMYSVPEHFYGNIVGDILGKRKKLKQAECLVVQS